MEDGNEGNEKIRWNLTSCKQYSKDFVKSRLPILKWFPQYTTASIIPDAVAGLTVGLMAIPQTMAFAVIAGLTPEYGLYSSFIGPFLYIFLGSCRQLTVGPVAVAELIAFETCGQSYPECVILAGFYAGIVQLLMALLRIGMIVSLISDPVTIGFTAGAALTISSSQLKSLFGLSGPGKTNGFINSVKYAISNITSVSVGDTVLGCICIIALLLLQKLKDYIKVSENTTSGRLMNRLLWFLSISRNIVIVIVTSIVAYSWENPPFALTGAVKSGFPTPGLPHFELPIYENSTLTGEHLSFTDTWSEQLKAGPLSIALISVLQNVAIAKAFGSGQSIDATQEMYALGCIHVVGSFFGSIPVAGSFSRSAVNEASGVRSPISGFFTGILIIFALGFLTSSFYYIPKSSLAAVIICALASMIDYEAIRPMWKVSKLDVVACLVTFLASLLLGMENGILIGVGVSLLVYLLGPMRPKIHTEGVIVDEDTESYTIITPEQGFSFPSVDYVRTFINQLVLEDNTKRVFVLNLERAVSSDFTSQTALVSLIKGLDKTGKLLLILNANSKWVPTLQTVGMSKKSILSSREEILSFLNPSPTSHNAPVQSTPPHPQDSLSEVHNDNDMSEISIQDRRHLTSQN